MEFTGFFQNKRNLYSEMKIFVTKKSSSFGIRPIVPSTVSHNVSEEAIPMINTSTISENFSFYYDLKQKQSAFNSKLTQTKIKISSCLKSTFDVKSSQEEEIEKQLGTCYQIIKSFDSKMKEQIHQNNDFPANSAAERFRRSISVHMSSVFSKMIKQLKKEEQKFYQAVKAKKGKSQGSYFDFIHDEHISDDKRVVYSDKGDKMILTDVSKHTQAEDLSRMLEQINSLTDLLSQMNEMVVEQGTLVDRIDMNLEDAVTKTKKGNEELLKAKEELEKGCAARLLRYLIVANLIIFLLLLLKLR